MIRLDVLEYATLRERFGLVIQWTSGQFGQSLTGH
jgi:hypothetical protein